MENSPAVPPSLKGVPFIYRTEVRFRDLDVLGHVNNSVYLNYFESTRLAYYTELMDVPLEKIDIILAEITVKYHAPAFYNDRLAIGARVASIGNKSFTMEYKAVRESDDKLIASARSVLVAYDYATGRTTPVTDRFRAIVVERQGSFDSNPPS